MLLICPDNQLPIKVIDVLLKGQLLWRLTWESDLFTLAYIEMFMSIYKDYRVECYGNTKDAQDHSMAWLQGEGRFMPKDCHIV